MRTAPILATLLILLASFAGCLTTAIPTATGDDPPSPDGNSPAPAPASTTGDGEGDGNASSPPAGAAAASEASPPTPPTVVAVPDSGANPYHEVFHGGPTFADVPGFPATASAVNLTLNASSYRAAVDADAEAWSQVEVGDLVWFPGTRLAGISFGTVSHGPFPYPIEYDKESEHPVLDEDGHGTVTSHAVIDAAPHAVVVMVQIPDDEDLIPAMEWIAAQDWIDLVSVSWATWGTEYVEGEARMGLPAAYRQAFDSGKLILNGAGNEPVPHVHGEHNGPPFVVAVGGSENATRGENAVASKAPDIVAPFTQEHRASVGTLDGYVTTAGTSLSTPFAAGAVAEALWLVRDAVGANRTGASPHLIDGAPGPGALADGRLTRDELWSAMNGSAKQWTAADWRPGADLNEWWSLPVAHPALQMGWGEVTPHVTAPMADLLLGRGEAAEKAPGTAEWMAARQDARAEVWS